MALTNKVGHSVTAVIHIICALDLLCEQTEEKRDRTPPLGQSDRDDIVSMNMNKY